MVNITVKIVRFYQSVISSILPPRCRFHPSCSQYAIEAFQRYGFIKGLFCSMRRLLKCHPLHPGGHDPL